MFNLKPGVTLKDFQVEGVRYLLLNHYAILGDKMGLGKSIQAIAVASYLRLPTLVVCPAGLVQNWLSEIDTFSMRDNVKIIKSGADLANFEPSDEHFVVMSYSLLEKAGKLFDWCEYLVTDEAHYLKNPDAKRTNYFLDLLKKHKIKRFTELSGTIIKNGVNELYTQLVFMEQSPIKKKGPYISQFCDNYWSFQRTFSNAHTEQIRGRTVTKFTGVKNLNLLKKILKGNYLRRDESVLNLPPYVEKDVIINYEGEDDELWQAFLQKDKSSDSRTKAMAAFKKAKFTAQYAKDLFESEGTPIVIYSAHVEACREVAKRLGVSYYDGTTSKSNRNRIIDDFKAGRHSYFVATIGAASTGHTFVGGNNLIFNDIDWVPGNNDQALKRIHRIGQTKTCFIHYIFGTKTDKRIKLRVISKAKVLKEVL